MGKLPINTATLLRDVADWLDQADEECRQHGLSWDPEPEIQHDVRRLADWFDTRPDIDLAAFQAITPGWGSDAPLPDGVEIEQRLRALKVGG